VLYQLSYLAAGGEDIDAALAAGRRSSARRPRDRRAPGVNGR
jgi:hypothetical protein